MCRRYAFKTCGLFSDASDEFSYREWVFFLLYTDNYFSFPEYVTETYSYLFSPVWKELLTVHLYPLIDGEWILEMASRITGGAIPVEQASRVVDVSGSVVNNRSAEEAPNVMGASSNTEEEAGPTKSNHANKSKKKNKKKKKKQR